MLDRPLYLLTHAPAPRKGAMRRASRAIVATLSILIAIAMTAALAPAALADPTVGSDPTSLSQPTTTIVAYYRHPTMGHLMKVNQTSTIGGGIGSHSMGVSATFNVQRVGTVQYCPPCPVQPYPVEQSFTAHYMNGRLDATATPGQGVFTLPAVDANGAALGKTVEQVVSELLGPPWEANRDARLAADQAIVNGSMPMLSTAFGTVDASAYGLGLLSIGAIAAGPWLSQCLLLSGATVSIAAGIISLHRDIWKGGDQDEMAFKKWMLTGAYTAGATLLVGQWISCNVEADRLARATATAAGVAHCTPLGLQPHVYAACVLAVEQNLYPSFRGLLTAALATYTGALIATFIGAGVYFSF